MWQLQKVPCIYRISWWIRKWYPHLPHFLMNTKWYPYLPHFLMNTKWYPHLPHFLMNTKMVPIFTAFLDEYKNGTHIYGISCWIQKWYPHLSYTSFRSCPSCNYALLPAIVKVLETFLEAILWKNFQLVRRILDDVSIIKKCRHFNADFRRGNRQISAGV